MLAGRTIGNIRHPDLRWFLCDKGLIQHIVLHRMVVFRIRGGLILPYSARFQALRLHQATHRFLRNLHPFFS